MWMPTNAAKIHPVTAIVIFSAKLVSAGRAASRRAGGLVVVVMASPLSSILEGVLALQSAG